MEPFSYFLPPRYRSCSYSCNSNNMSHINKSPVSYNHGGHHARENNHSRNDTHRPNNNTNHRKENIRMLQSVYSHRLEENNNCQKKFTDNGRSMTFGKRTDSTFTFTTYHMPVDTGGLVTKQCRVFSAMKSCDYSLYCCVEEICFMFTLKESDGNAGSVCSIHVSCICFNEDGGTNFHEDIAVLQYQHKFNQYCCSQSNNERKIVIVTGRDLDAYGTDEEIVDNYVDVLSYKKNTENGVLCNQNRNRVYSSKSHSSSNGHSPSKSHKLDEFHRGSLVTMAHERRKNVTKCCSLFDIDRIFFSLCGSKLFLIFGKSFIVYSMSEDAFGPVLELPEDDRYHMSRYCFYLHNWCVGNVLLVCQSDGLIYTIRERNLSLELMQEREIDLGTYGFDDEHLFTFLHVDHFNDVLIYFTVEKELFVLDYLSQCVVGKFVSKKSHYIVDVKTNWSGEEVFVFCDLKGCRSPCGQLEILFNRKFSSLKDLAKIKVLQVFSKNKLKNLEVPTNLKLEMNIL